MAQALSSKGPREHPSILRFGISGPKIRLLGPESIGPPLATC